jgi:hypothetical protein
VHPVPHDGTAYGPQPLQPIEPNPLTPTGAPIVSALTCTAESACDRVAVRFCASGLGAADERFGSAHASHAMPLGARTHRTRGRADVVRSDPLESAGVVRGANKSVDERGHERQACPTWPLAGPTWPLADEPRCSELQHTTLGCNRSSDVALRLTLVAPLSFSALQDLVDTRGSHVGVMAAGCACSVSHWELTRGLSERRQSIAPQQQQQQQVGTKPRSARLSGRRG